MKEYKIKVAGGTGLRQRFVKTGHTSHCNRLESQQTCGFGVS